MQRIRADGPGAFVAYSLVLAAWFTTSQPAKAWSLLDLLPAQMKPEPAVDDGVTAYAEEWPYRYRHRRHWRHSRHHREHAPVELPVAFSAASSSVSMPNRSPPEQLQLVLTTANGGDPFEQLMTTYYWNYHAIPKELIFEPAGRSVEVGRASDEAQRQQLAASMIDRTLEESRSLGY
jgi:hypothetical protein